MTSRSAVILSVLAGVSLLAACGKPAEKPAAPEPAAAVQPAAPAPAAPAAPAGVTKATVASTNGAYPTADLPDWSAVKAVAFKDSSVGNASVVVVLSTYELPAANRAEFSKLSSPEKGQARLELWLVRQKQVAPGENLELAAGMYDPTKPQGQAEMTSSVAIALPGGSSLSFSQPQGTIEVTSVTADSISGKFDVKDKWTRISGEFSAPLK